MMEKIVVFSSVGTILILGLRINKMKQGCGQGNARVITEDGVDLLDLYYVNSGFTYENTKRHSQHICTFKDWYVGSIGCKHFQQFTVHTAQQGKNIFWLSWSFFFSERLEKNLFFSRTNTILAR